MMAEHLNCFARGTKRRLLDYHLQQKLERREPTEDTTTFADPLPKIKFIKSLCFKDKTSTVRLQWIDLL